MTEFVTDRHLGGYIRGGDPATYYPDLWRWLVDDQIDRVIDIGCGDGQAVKFFQDEICFVVGVDGMEQENPAIVVHDYTTGPYQPDDRFDLAWCCEFVEHVEERYVPNFLATFQCADLVLMTHAFPGQPGHYHVNCQEPDYWKGVMAAIGYEYDHILTYGTRDLARMNESPWNHYVRSGMAFKRL